MPIIGLALLASTASRAVAQAQPAGPRLAPVVQPYAWSAPGTWESISGSRDEPRGNRSAARIIATHTVVGTATGLVIGLVLSGASVGDDQSSVVWTWTGLGAVAGIASGVVACLVRPNDSP